MPANSAWERGGIIRRGGYVMSHRLTVTSLSVCVWGNRCATFEQGARSFPTSIYSVYDYNGGIAFHGRVLPRQTTILEGGTSVLQIHLENMDDANNDPHQFIPTRKMLSHGPGAIMVGPFRFPESVRTPAGYSGVIQPVIVHAILDQKGKVLDAEVVQTSDPALAAAALGVVWHSSYLPAERQGRPLQREAFINVKFTPAS
jgi:hypothetical protein